MFRCATGLPQPAPVSFPPLDIATLKSAALSTLFEEMEPFLLPLRVERVPDRRGPWIGANHPALTVGFSIQQPIIRILDSLSEKEQVEAIAHELAHLLIVYRHRMRLVERCAAPPLDPQQIFEYCLNFNRFWNYFLGQMVNSLHHLVLIDYLRKEYGIESTLHLSLFRQHVDFLFHDQSEDRETQYAKGMVAFEYEKTIGKDFLDILSSSSLLWKVYTAAQEVFGEYGLEKIPSPSRYEEDILTFLEGLGYRGKDFTFLPHGMKEDPSRQGVPSKREPQRGPDRF